MSIRSFIRTTLDLTFAFLCIGPLSIVYWRGTFNAISEITFRDLTTFEGRVLPALVLFLTGAFMKIALDLTKYSIRDSLLNKESNLQIFASSIVLYVDALFGVVMWVGGFNMLYVFPGLHWFSLSSVLFIASIVLVLLQTFHSTVGVPFKIKSDKFINVFDPQNYFSTKFEGDNVSCMLILDTVFVNIVVHTLVICCWWGLWELENRYIFFLCEITVQDIKAWDSVIIAYFLVLVVLAINNELTSEETSSFCSKRTAANFVAFLSFIAAVNYWRGVWSLIDFYFFPRIGHWENLLLCHIIGFLGSLFAGTTLSLTQSSRKDSINPEFFTCQHFSNDLVRGDLNHYEDLDEHEQSYETNQMPV